MSQLHRDYFNLLSPLISPYQQQNGIMSLEIRGAAVTIVLMKAANHLRIQNTEQILDDLGFTLSNSRITLLPHPFNLDMNYYQQNVIGPLSADTSGRLNFASIVQRTHRVHDQVDAYLDYFRYFPSSSL
ncbi:hypothetical protein L7G72_12930 [Xenorhabdus bovienii]|uniref:hypothetical protein n=1 Tax=Xenorhabdus bovienii TaxID=40576 RepID=UPI001EDF8DD3|nr:hypothetical protein [Xenorhabdus bovienii]MCG3462743.1 hypothetical protein [Xenorhabdus bovienii]